MARQDDTEEIVTKLDRLLPEGINRRRFLQASAGGFTAAVAGCLGANGNGGGNGNGKSNGDADVVWRQPWAQEPTWSIAYIANLEGHWEDAGIDTPNVQPGEGSPDTARRIGTGEEEIGQAEFGSCVTGLAEGQDMRFFSVPKPRALLGFIYRTDRIKSEEDLEGKNIGLASPFAEETWPIFPEAVGVNPDNVNADYVEEDAAPGQLAKGNLDAIYGALDLLGTYRDQVGDNVELGVTPINNYLTVIGYPLMVNGKWLDEDDGNMDYLTGVLEGYSAAMKWCLLNPEKTIDIMIDEVNEELQIQDRETLSSQMRWNVAISATEETRKEGLGWFSEDQIQSSLDNLTIMVDNPNDLPNASDIIEMGPIENAELSTLNDDEWKQVVDYTKEESSFFE
ncbi:ABC transporter substrate-binding protein [Halegenticoccus tardaugens]|uniref:ABC transporter substrate-binding protein n=1 Tax=Halegenticoccus tardaugens TaxID=2071624 RepID=UPI00100AE038|nr:ABC transporter substrate-binding protein [Halegenticoccus tardaugens]